MIWTEPAAPHPVVEPVSAFRVGNRIFLCREGRVKSRIFGGWRSIWRRGRTRKARVRYDGRPSKCRLFLWATSSHPPVGRKLKFQYRGGTSVVAPRDRSTMPGPSDESP